MLIHQVPHQIFELRKTRIHFYHDTLPEHMDK